MPRTLFDKIWDAHEVADGLLYIDLHLVHEVTSPQAFESLRLAGRTVRRPDRTLATADHNVPTDGSTAAAQIRDQLSRVQVETLERNCAEFGVPIYSIGSARQGIVHVIGPELGVTQPGMTIVCGDSHTSTHGAFGALAFGIGTSEVEHVLATQTLQQRKPRSMRIRYEGELGFGVTAKDLILGTIGRIGVAGGVGHVIEYAGPAIEALSMEGRMTVCNMTIEGGGRAGMIAPDDTTFEWVEGREAAPDPLPLDEWRELHTDDGAEFDTEVVIDASALSPQVTWGTTPGHGRRRDRRRCPSRATRARSARSTTWRSSAGTPMQEIELDRVFIGSCTNSRIGDLREAAEVVQGPQVASSVDAMVVPGSQQVKAQAEAEGLDEVFRAAGFDWRSAGCSMCLGMNPDIAAPGERVRLDLEPQLRGPPGPGRPHAPRQPEDGRRGRDRGPLRRHQGVELMDPVRHHRRRRLGARPRRRRHRPDHPQAVPQAGRAHRLRRVPLLRLGEGARLGPAEQPDPRHRPQLRLRLLARARALGARGLRLPRDRGAELRRHLLLQLHQDRAAAGGARRGRRQGADGGRPRRASTSRSRRSSFAGRQVPLRDRRRRSRGGCSRASTTSASRSRSEHAIDRYEPERERSGPVTTSLGAREPRLGRGDLRPRLRSAGRDGDPGPRPAAARRRRDGARRRLRLRARDRAAAGAPARRAA